MDVLSQYQKQEVTACILNVKTGLDSDSDLNTLEMFLKQVEEISNNLEEAF